MNNNKRILAIAKWNEAFENSNSRKLKRMEWVPMPTDLIGSTGYNLMLDEFESEAPSIYGAWSALVAIASQCSTRGTLADGQGNPLKISHLSRKSGFPAETFERLIEWATSKEVSWLILVGKPEENDDPPDASHQSPTKPGESSDGTPAGREKLRATVQDKTENGITEQDSSNASKAFDGFEEFWKVVHRKVAKDAARKAFAKAVKRVAKQTNAPTRKVVERIIEKMKLFAESRQASHEVKGKLHPATWLNDGRYEDDVSVWNETEQGKGIIKSAGQQQYENGMAALEGI